MLPDLKPRLRRGFLFGIYPNNLSESVQRTGIMKSTKAYSTGLKELRLKLGIKPPLAQTETDERAAAFRQRVDAVVQKSRKRSEIANDRMRGAPERWPQHFARSSIAPTVRPSALP